MTDDSSLMMSATHLRRLPVDVVAPLSAVSLRQGLPSLAARLDDVRTWLASDLGELEGDLALFERALPDGAPVARHANLAERAARHLLRQRGKRLRPICTHLGGRLSGVNDRRVRELAVASELVHAATLLHDDVIDEGTERRGAPAARIVYGNSASILAGDYLLIEALARVRAAGGGAPLGGLLETISQMVAAEALQLEQRGRFVPDREVYYAIIEGKTASLFRWAMSAASLLVEAPCHEPLGRMGLELGLAFQLVDDALDLEGAPEEIGKDLFADLLQGKLTYPLIAACESEPSIARDVRAISRDAAAGDIDDVRAAAVVARIRGAGALETTRALASNHKRRALAALGELPASRASEALAAVVEAAVERRS